MKIGEHGPDLAILQRLVDSLPAFIFTNRPDGYLDYCNQRMLEYLGVSFEALEGWGWGGVVHPDDVAEVTARWQASVTSGEPYECEARVRRADGVYRWMLHREVPSRDETGQIVRWYGSSIDIDDRKRAEHEVRKHETVHATLEAQLQATLNIIPAYTWYAVPSGGLTFVNQRCADYLGLPSDHPLRFGIDTDAAWDAHIPFLHPDDREEARRVWQTCLRTESAGEFSFRAYSGAGAYRWFLSRAEPLRASDGTLLYWIGINLDIEERKQAELYLAELTKALRESEEELRQMLDLTPQIVGVLGPRRERLYFNRVALAYFGISLDEWRQGTVESNVHPDDVDRVKAGVARSLSNPTAYELEMRLRKADGTYRWFLVRYNPFRDDQGQLLRWYTACTDIDDRKKAEDRLQQENVALREEVDKASMFEEIIGSSPALVSVLSRVSKVARSDSTVLITGETGTGKELVARAIHRTNRSTRAFVSVNCAAIPRELIASELFGHEKGAFTGAIQRRLGRFELADGGTIFLDEVGELSPDTQVALLRVLQEREFERVGGRQPIRVDVRVIAATNRDLNAAAASGMFRQDLFYRLNVFPVTVPPLRERADDIPLLVEYFIDRYARKVAKSIRSVNKRTLDRLQSYPWPGNVRELQNVIERSVIVCETDEFTVDDSWLSSGPAVESRLALSSSVADHEKTIIEDALRASGGRVFGASGAAARLGIARSTLESKIRALGIDKNRFRPRPAKL
jgi:formate hydrogenlyase transcriptional activator